MLRFYGEESPGKVADLRLGGICPYCNVNTRFNLTTLPDNQKVVSDKLESIILGYSCDSCLQPIPIQWDVNSWDGSGVLFVDNAAMIVAAREPFNFDFVPEEVRSEIEEALNCLSVNAYHGFAALCRRVVQAIATDLGAGATDKIKKQAGEMILMAGLDDEWKELINQMIITGHDGAHPHLPSLNAGRSAVLLSLLKDLIYELYTRQGRIKEAALLRQKAIDQKK